MAPDPVVPLTPVPAAAHDVPLVGVTSHVNVAVLPNSTLVLNLWPGMLLLFNLIATIVVLLVAVVSGGASTLMFTYLYVVPTELVHLMPYVVLA